MTACLARYPASPARIASSTSLTRAALTSVTDAAAGLKSGGMA